MTNAKAAEVLRRHNEFLSQAHNAGLLPDALTTAIAALEATPSPPKEEEIRRVFCKHSDCDADTEDTEGCIMSAMTLPAFTAAVRELFKPK